MFCAAADSLSSCFSSILNDSVEALSALKSTIVLLAGPIACSSLQYCHEIRDFLKYLSTYYIKLWIDVSTSISWAWSTCVLFILLTQLLNSAQFLNMNFSFALYGAAAVAAAPVIVPLTSIYASSWL